MVMMEAVDGGSAAAETTSLEAHALAREGSLGHACCQLERLHL